jgi:hypothetical protein
MTSIYRKLWHHLALLSTIAAIAVIAGVAMWLAAQAVGLHLPLPSAIAVAGALLIWSLANDRGGPPSAAAPLPPQAPRVLSKSDVEVLLILQREGLISATELRGALDGLIPPRAPSSSSDQSARGHRHGRP